MFVRLRDIYSSQSPRPSPCGEERRPEILLCSQATIQGGSNINSASFGALRDHLSYPWDISAHGLASLVGRFTREGQ